MEQARIEHERSGKAARRFREIGSESESDASRKPMGPLTLGFFLATRSTPRVGYPSSKVFLG